MTSQPETNKPLITSLLLVGVITGMVLSSVMTYLASQREVDPAVVEDALQYCAATARYEADAARGVAEVDRRGMAPYKGRTMCK